MKHAACILETVSGEIGLLHLDIEDEIAIAAKENGVLVSKGSWFAVSNTKPTSVCFRMTFAAAPQDALDVAVARFGNALLRVLEIK